MNYPFKIITDPAPTNPSVSDTNFKDFYQNVNKNIHWATFLPDVRRVSRDIIAPAITEEFYAYLLDQYHTNASALTDAENAVLEYLQDAAAFYTVWKLSPKHNVTIGEMGVQEQSGTDGTSTPSSQWRYKNFHWNIMKEADELLDRALAYLEKNQDSFTTFKNNKANLIINDSYVRHTDDYQEFIHIHDSRRTFTKLIPSLRKAQREVIEKMLGYEYHVELLTQLQGGTLTAENEKVVKLVQELQVYQSLQYALPHLSVVIESDGIKLVTSTDGMNSKQTAHDERLAALKHRNDKDVDKAHQNLIEFLYSNEDDYPTWKNSDAYTYFDQDDSGYPLTFEGGGGIVFD